MQKSVVKIVFDLFPPSLPVFPCPLNGGIKQQVHAFRAQFFRKNQARMRRSHGASHYYETGYDTSWSPLNIPEEWYDRFPK